MQQTDRNILEALRAKHGDKQIAFMQEQHIEALIGEKAGKPAAQRNLLRVLRSLLKVAVKAKMRRDNPALGIELERLKTTGYHSWSEEELRQYEARHPVGTKARLALHLLLYTAQRRTDVVALGRPNMRNGRFIYTASKNKVEIDIPVGSTWPILCRSPSRPVCRRNKTASSAEAPTSFIARMASGNAQISFDLR